MIWSTKKNPQYWIWNKSTKVAYAGKTQVLWEKLACANYIVMQLWTKNIDQCNEITQSQNIFKWKFPINLNYLLSNGIFENMAFDNSRKY